jgi:hypothetical protein
MAENRGFPVTIEGDEFRAGAIDLWELTQFLRLFRAAYVAAYEKVAVPSADSAGRLLHIVPLNGRFLDSEIIYQAHDMVELLRTDLKTFPRIRFVRMAERELPGGFDIKVTRISFQSPLQIAFDALPLAFGAAVILSGGEFKLGSFLHVKLPPLGTGISKLREAFGLRSSVRRRRR